MNNLSAELLAAQDSVSRHPLVDIKSAQFAADIPFTGQRVTAATLDEQDVAGITHSSGRLVGCYVEQESVGASSFRTIKFFYTDTARTRYTYGTLVASTGTSASDLSLCELADGRLALVYVKLSDSTYSIQMVVFNYDGSSPVTSALASGTSVLYSPSLLQLPSSLLLVYINGTTNKLQLKTATTIVGPWGTSSEPSISGIGADPKYDTALARLSSGDVWLAVTYQTAGDATNAVFNLFYTVSHDGGATWGTAVALTSFNTPQIIARRPVIAAKALNDIIVAFDESMASLYKNYGTDANWTVNSTTVWALHFDSTARKAYVFTGQTKLDQILRIDVDAWIVDRYWTYDTVPAIPSYCRDGSTALFRFCAGSGKYMLFMIDNSDWPVYYLLDDEVNIFKEIVPHATTYLEKQANVQGYQFWGSNYANIAKDGAGCYIDEANHTLYITDKWLSGNADNAAIYIGTIDFSGSSFEYSQVMTYEFQTSVFGWSALDCVAFKSANVRIDFTSGFVAFAMTPSTSGSLGKRGVLVFTISNGGLYRYYNHETYDAFPVWGLANLQWHEGKIWGIQGEYTTLDNQDGLFGLISIDTSTDAVQWYLPNFATAQKLITSGLWVTEQGYVLFLVDNYGIAVYDSVNQAWNLLNTTSVPGIYPASVDWAGVLRFDEANQCIICGMAGYSGGGLVYVPITGKLNRAYYRQYDGSNFSAAVPLVKGLMDSGAALCVADNTLYCFWQRWSFAEGSQLYWDLEAGQFDLWPYLMRGEQISQKRSIDGTPGKLTFTISDGPLFDHHNVNSLMSRYLRKGKKITLRWGEQIGGVNYWQDGSSVYVVKGTGLNYRRGTYPSMTVDCEDIRTFWEQMHITASPYYGDSLPHAAMVDLLERYANLTADGISITALDKGLALYHQFLDQSLRDALTKICSRYGYFMDVRLSDNKVTARKIAKDNVIDHVYPDTSQLLEFTPDDSFSSFTNRVTVQGEGRYDLEILMSEEQVGSQAGTVGFFTPKQTHRIFYSEDHNRRVKYPRLEVTQKVESIGYALAGGISLGVSAVGEEDHWIEVTVTGKNLWPMFALGLALILAARTGSWVNSAAAINQLSQGTFICLQVLGAVGNYAFEIHGQPCGTVKQTFEDSADDFDLQKELGGIVMEERITDELCYDVTQCKTVAEQELWVAQAQRNRVKCSKLAHLQDDAGDTIQHPHPFSGFAMKIFITDLERVMVIPDEGNGEFTDKIEGWVL